MISAISTPAPHHVNHATAATSASKSSGPQEASPAKVQADNAHAISAGSTTAARSSAAVLAALSSLTAA